MGFEPTTSTLARLRSTPELHPLEMIGALQRPCAEEYIRFSGLGKIFLEKKSCFPGIRMSPPAWGRSRRKCSGLRYMLFRSLLMPFLGKRWGRIKTGLFRKGPFGPALEQSR